MISVTYSCAPKFNTILLHSLKILSNISTDINILSCGWKASKNLLKLCHYWPKIKKAWFLVHQEEIFGSHFNHTEAQNERLCQSYSASHIAQIEQTAFFTARPFSVLIRPFILSHCYNQLAMTSKKFLCNLFLGGS